MLLAKAFSQYFTHRVLELWLDVDVHNVWSGKSKMSFIEKPPGALERPKSATQKYVEDKVFSLTSAIKEDEEEEEEQVEYEHHSGPEEREVDGESDCT